MKLGSAAVCIFLCLLLAGMKWPRQPSQPSQPSQPAQPSPAPQPPVTWEQVVNLTNDPAKSVISQANGFQVGVDAAGRVHVGFRDNRLDTRIQEVYYKRMAGGTWSAARQLSNLAALVNLGADQVLDTGGPAIAVTPSGRVHVVWNFAVLDSAGVLVQARRTYYQRSLDGGLTFSAPLLLGEGGDSFGGAAICASEQLLVVMSTTTSKRAMYAGRSTDSGATFTYHAVATYDSAKEAAVCAVDTAGVVYAVWQDDRDGLVVGGVQRRDVHFSRSLDGGQAWQPAQNLSNTPSAGSADQSIAVGPDGRVHVAYHDDSFDGDESWETYYAGSPDRGSTWYAPQKLTTTAPASGSVNIDLPSIAAAAGGIHIVWQDRRGGLEPLVYYMRGDGVTWEREIPIAEGLRSGYAPTIAASLDGSALHVVWQGRVRGATVPDIYYRRARLW